ncbi:MAG TPA: MotA/TolQ/ExbB proton channel family protein [Verrucomicrobiae bacterium]|jgi:hypothetical protein|nr:MotA/TolQ/ExbB proton channel family protein [Verrucomicrobiae bacterium]
MIKWAISQLGKIPVPTRLLPFLGVLMATALIILLPLGGVPYIEVNSTNLTFDLPTFQNFEINFQDSVEIKDCGIGLIPPPSTNAVSEIHLIPVVANIKASSLLIRNPLANQVNNGLATNAFKVHMDISSDVAVRISSVAINGSRLKLATFAKNNLKVHSSELVRFHYIRRYLASWIFKFNDVVSNWILTALSVGCVIVFCKVADMEIQVYFFSDSRLKKRLNKFLRIKKTTTFDNRRKAFDKYIAQWHKWDSRFRFLQALGPAIGFILTVSSLVEVLHPATRSTNDLDAFLTGIHVAMISTFLGLLLRLISLEGGRANDVLLDRSDVLIDSEEPRQESTTPLPQLRVEL